MHVTDALPVYYHRKQHSPRVAATPEATPRRLWRRAAKRRAER